MSNPSRDRNWESWRDSIIGLGEQSHKKSFYPLLQKKIRELERFKALVNNISDGIFMLKLPFGEIVDLNSGGLHFLTPAQRGRQRLSITDIFPMLPFELLEQEQALSLEYEHYEKGMMTLQFNFEMKEFDKEPFGLLVVRDISSEVKAQKDLRESESRFRMIFNSVNDGIFVHDMVTGDILDVNQKMLDMFRYTYEEALTCTIGQLSSGVSPYDDEGALALLKKAALGIPQIYEWHAQDKEGRLFWVEGNMRLALVNGQTRILVAVRNIEERKRIEHELLEAKSRAEEGDRLKTAFLANMSHEIRTPMNGILGFSELLSDKDLPEEDKLEFISIIQKSGKQLLHIVNDIIDISKIEVGQVEIHYEDFYFHDLMEEALLPFYREYEAKGIDLLTVFPEERGDFYLFCDGLKIKQIVSNLVSNALKFTEKGSVELGFHLDEKKIHCYVQDTGMGIPAEYQKVIFDRFHQYINPDTDKNEGTGLGLSICKAFIEKMNGKMQLSSAEGQGSRFSFIIPYYPFSEEGFSAFRDSDGNPVFQNDEYTVLIAEDDEINYLLIRKYSEPHCGRLLHARNGEEAVSMVKENPSIHLILMDLKMPRMDGLEASKIIKKDFPHIPIVVQTAYAMADDLEVSSNKLFSGYLAKPIKSRLIQEVLEQYNPHG